jgi:UDP-sugar transporter A1/2/3
VAVIWTEFIKLLVCMVAQLVECARSSGQRGLKFRGEVLHQAEEILGRSWPMLVPAGLFVMQQVQQGPANSLWALRLCICGCSLWHAHLLTIVAIQVQAPAPVMRQVLVIVAASHLDAVTFQICSQSFKIMPTALFAVWLLGQYLTPLQWGSLPVLAVGVVFVTMNGSMPAGGDGMAGQSDLILGLAASALSGLSSAYAGGPHILLPRFTQPDNLAPHSSCRSKSLAAFLWPRQCELLRPCLRPGMVQCNPASAVMDMQVCISRSM